MRLIAQRCITDENNVFSNQLKISNMSYDGIFFGPQLTKTCRQALTFGNKWLQIGAKKVLYGSVFQSLVNVISPGTTWSWVKIIIDPGTTFQSTNQFMSSLGLQPGLVILH